MIESSDLEGKSDIAKRLVTMVLSLVLHVFLLLVVIIVPLWFFNMLPEAELLTFLIAPPPPPPPPPHPVSDRVRISIRPARTSLASFIRATPLFSSMNSVYATGCGGHPGAGAPYPCGECLDVDAGTSGARRARGCRLCRFTACIATG